MARETLLICDFGRGTCRNVACSYRLWRDGDKQAWAVDLCDEHAAPMLTLIAEAPMVDLPSKPRMRMEVTKLKSTPKTAHLKKKG